MDVYKTEEEQLESIKNWFKKNGNGIVVGIVFIVVFFGGRSFWTSHMQDDHEQVYVHFETVSELRDTALTDKESDEAFKAYVNGIDGLKTAKPEHALTHLAVLKVAADFVEKAFWDDAESELRWLQEQKIEPALDSLVVFRLAQVLFQKEQFDAALALIADITMQNDDYLPRLKELEGDVYIQKEQPVKALKSYQEAAVANTEKGLTSVALQWKIDDLAGVN